MGLAATMRMRAAVNRPHPPGYDPRGVGARMDITIDAAAMSPMLGRQDVFNALLDALHERRGGGEAAHLLKLRLRRSLQGQDLTVRVARAQARVPAELAFIGRTLAEVAPQAHLVLE